MEPLPTSTPTFTDLVTPPQVAATALVAAPLLLFSAQLLGQARLCGNVIFSIHNLYRLRMEYGGIVTDKNKFAACLASNALFVALGGSGIFQMAAQVVRIARLILEAQEQTKVVYIAWNRLLIAWLLPQETLEHTDTNSFAYNQQLLQLRIGSIYKEALSFLYALWKLSAYYVDLFEALSMTPEAQRKAIDTLFINGQTLYNTGDAPKRVYEELKNNELVIGKIFLFLRIEKSAADWVGEMGEFLQKIHYEQGRMQYWAGGLKSFASKVIDSARIVYYPESLPEDHWWKTSLRKSTSTSVTV